LGLTIFFSKLINQIIKVTLNSQMARNRNWCLILLDAARIVDGRDIGKAFTGDLVTR